MWFITLILKDRSVHLPRPSLSFPTSAATNFQHKTFIGSNMRKLPARFEDNVNFVKVYGLALFWLTYLVL